eukprot:403357991
MKLLITYLLAICALFLQVSANKSQIQQKPQMTDEIYCRFQKQALPNCRFTAFCPFQEMECSEGKCHITRNYIRDPCSPL